MSWFRRGKTPVRELPDRSDYPITTIPPRLSRDAMGLVWAEIGTSQMMCLSHAASISVVGTSLYSFQNPNTYFVEAMELGDVRHGLKIAQGTYEEAHRFYEEVRQFLVDA